MSVPPFTCGSRCHDPQFGGTIKGGLAVTGAPGYVNYWFLHHVSSEESGFLDGLPDLDQLPLFGTKPTPPSAPLKPNFDNVFGYIKRAEFVVLFP